jgi:nucleoside-diphosphate-sugar epimerase
MTVEAPSSAAPFAAMRDVPVLVTGGAGFIGSHLVEALVAAGAHVRVLDDLSSGRESHLAAVATRCELLRGDVRAARHCRQACAGVRVVFHEAARVSVAESQTQPATTLEVNALGTTEVLEAAREQGVERVIYASSSSVYGDSRAPRQREGEEGEPLSPYALSKRLAEEVAAHFHRHLGLPTFGLRYFNVYGPRQRPDGDYAAVVPRFASTLLQGETPVIYGDGLQSRDFVHVDDVVAANLAAAVAPLDAAGAAYNVGSGEAIAVVELLATLRRLSASTVEPSFEPGRAGEVLHSCADPSLARERLGFATRVSLEDGLRGTLAALASAGAS